MIQNFLLDSVAEEWEDGMIAWGSVIGEIKARVESGETLESIGKTYGVTKQRLYQVLAKYGIKTPQRVTANFLRDRDHKYYWLNKMLVHKKFSHADRMELLEALNLPDVCPALGIKLNYSKETLAGDDSPSVDRIDNERGYEKDNVHVISCRANRLKSDGTAAELRKIADYLDTCTAEKKVV